MSSDDEECEIDTTVCYNKAFSCCSNPCRLQKVGIVVGAVLGGLVALFALFWLARRACGGGNSRTLQLGSLEATGDPYAQPAMEKGDWAG